LTSIIYDERYPERSVAVLQDMSQERRYNVRVDDEFGRLRVAAIRKYEVVLTIEEFGVPRQVVISLRRRQEGNP
jgi:lysozyme family protein